MKKFFLKKKVNQKIFCIGNNKTGTSSLFKYFSDHGFKVANQREAELLFDCYIDRDWNKIIEYCEKYEVFQDVPFSLNYTYTILHHVYPNSKFILSVRDSSEQWYDSLSQFHSKIFGLNGHLPTKEDLQNAVYIEKGRPWKVMKELYGDFIDPYNKSRLIKSYEDYNEGVRNYFKNNSNFLEINISEKDSIKKLSDFLKIDSLYSVFPHENKTSDL